MVSLFQKFTEFVLIVLIIGTIGDMFGRAAAAACAIVVAVLFVTGWWKKPVAAIGALSVAYHECIRDRRTGICSECGKLTDAVIQQCPKCGGVVEENPHPDEVLNEGTT